jgi:hypothetical protein
LDKTDEKWVPKTLNFDPSTKIILGGLDKDVRIFGGRHLKEKINDAN